MVQKDILFSKLKNKKAKIAIWSLFLLMGIISIMFMYFVFAAHVVTTSDGTIYYNINEDVGFIYNITVNNSDSGQNANITQVNITLPSGVGFLFIRYSNWTNALGSFTNTSSILSWSNLTYYLINGTQLKTFWFNATVATPGSYNLTITTINSSSVLQTNISVTINDTTAPSSIAFGADMAVNNSIRCGLPVNITATDNGVISTITAKIYNSSNSLISSSSSSTSPLTVTFSGLNGTYYVNATVNDTFGYSNSTGTRTYILTATCFSFNGTIKDINGNRLNNTIINVTLSVMGSNGPSALGYVSAISNESGGFNLSLPLNSAWMYLPVIRHFNSSTNAIDYVGGFLPNLPYAEFSRMAAINFYLKEAGTINITAINSTAARIGFKYQVKDTKLGYPIASAFLSNVDEAVVYVPKDRNYSISIYPTNSMPVSFKWDNFSSGSTNPYTGGDVNYNATISTVKKQFNTTMKINRYTGFFNKTNIFGWDSLIVVPLLLEPGNMIMLEHGVLPYNMSAWSGAGQSDLYTLASGFYNISLPGSPEALNVLLFAIGRNGSEYYSSFKNISLPYSGGGQNNFTTNNIYGLMGDYSNLSVNDAGGWSNYVNISLKEQTFNMLNSSGSALTSNAHAEVKVDYTSYGATEFTYMFDTSQTATSFSVPLLNITGIKEINIFSQMQAPKRISKTASQIVSNNNITLTNFAPGNINGDLANNQISVAIYISNTTCDIPGNEASCALTSTATMDSFNPLNAVMGGGKISFRMGVGNISVHYVNVDMLASGPPDGMFDNESGASESSSKFSNIMRFGSNGPTMYDYVLISLSYIEGSSSVTGLNESADVNISIPTFYDQDSNGNMNWTTPIWSSSNGTAASALAGNYTHYSAKQDEWQILMGQNNCTRTASELNASRPCYFDITNNRIWIRLPHFSGTAPEMMGKIITATEATGSTASGSSSGTVTGGAWRTYTNDKKEMSKLGSINSVLGKKERVRILVDGEKHFVGVVELTTTTATINVSSISQQVVLNVGEEKKFDVTSDGYYDLLIKLNKLLATKANITISYVNEKIGEANLAPDESTTATPTPSASLTPTPSTTPKSGGAFSGKSLIWILLIILVIAIVVWVVYLWTSKKGKVRRK